MTALPVARMCVVLLANPTSKACACLAVIMHVHACLSHPFAATCKFKELHVCVAVAGHVRRMQPRYDLRVRQNALMRLLRASTSDGQVPVSSVTVII